MAVKTIKTMILTCDRCGVRCNNDNRERFAIVSVSAKKRQGLLGDLMACPIANYDLCDTCFATLEEYLAERP